MGSLENTQLVRKSFKRNSESSGSESKLMLTLINWAHSLSLSRRENIVVIIFSNLLAKSLKPPDTVRSRSNKSFAAETSLFKPEGDFPPTKERN